MSLLKSGSVVAILTLISRIFGYVRDILMASLLGTGLQADAFSVAFKLPNFFRTLFAEGALSAAFVPMFTAKFISQGKEKAIKFADLVFTLLLISLLIFISLLEIAMPFIVYGLAPGYYGNQEKFNLVTYLSYITTPYLLFVSLASLLSGILNSVGRFATAAALPIILNITMILAITIFSNYFPTIAHALAFSILIAGVLQLIAISLVAKKLNLMPKIVYPRVTKDIKKLFSNMLPVIIGGSITQINLWIGTIIASQIDGAVSLLYYAERLNQFPLAIIGIAIGTVLLPAISQQIKKNNFDKANKIQNKAIEIALFFTLPCAFAYCVIGDSITTLLFERNAFTASDSLNVYKALFALALGLPAFVLIKILNPRFFAMQDTKTPVKISVICIILNIFLSILLLQYYAHIGIALSATITGWLNVSLLYYYLRKRSLFTLNKSSQQRIIKIIFCCLIMAIFLYIFKQKLSIIILGKGIKSLLSLSLIITIGICSYLIFSILTKTINFKEIKNLMVSSNG